MQAIAGIFALPFALALYVLVFVVWVLLRLTIWGLNASHNYDQAAALTTWLRGVVRAMNPLNWPQRRGSRRY